MPPHLPVVPVADAAEAFRPASLTPCLLFIPLFAVRLAATPKGTGTAKVYSLLLFPVSRRRPPRPPAVNGSASQLICHVYEWRRSWGEAGGALPGVAYTFLACPLLGWSYLPLATTAIKHVASLENTGRDEASAVFRPAFPLGTWHEYMMNLSRKARLSDCIYIPQYWSTFDTGRWQGVPKERTETSFLTKLQTKLRIQPKASLF